MKRRIVFFVITVFCLWWPGAASNAADGIWKDVPKDQPGDRYALYVQTYSTDSVVAVLLDNAAFSGQRRLFAFLGGDFTKGVDADELGGAPAHLTLSPPDTASPNGVFSFNGKSDSFELYRWFDATEGSALAPPDDGIHKNAPEPDSTDFSMWLQTYSENGSAVAVVTSDGAQSYYVFLDSDYSDGFDAQDLLSQGAHLAFTITENGDGSNVTYTAPDQNQTKGTLFRWFQASFISYVLAGQMKYADAPISQVTTWTPRLSIWDENVSSLRKYALDYSTTTGEYELFYVPEDAFITVWVCAPEVLKCTLPGNYMRREGVYAAGLSEAERAAYDFDLHIIIHLTSPWDNTNLEQDGAPPSHASPVSFQWDSVANATRYELEINQYRSSGHPDGYGYVDTLASELQLMNTTYSANLPASAPNEHYQLSLAAYMNDTRVGLFLSTLAIGGYSEEYWFRVQ